MTLNGVIAVTLRYFTEFVKRVPTHNRVDLWWNLCTSLLYCVVRVRCRHKESSRSLSHPLMSFLLIIIILLITLPSKYYIGTVTHSCDAMKL